RVRRIVSFNAGVALFDAAEQTRSELVLTVGGEDVTHDSSASCAERQAFDVAVLAELATDRVLDGSSHFLRVADCQRADGLRGGDVALEQQRRRLQRRRDVVEPEIAAVAWKQ